MYNGGGDLHGANDNAGGPNDSPRGPNNEQDSLAG